MIQSRKQRNRKNQENQKKEESCIKVILILGFSFSVGLFSGFIFRLF